MPHVLLAFGLIFGPIAGLFSAFTFMDAMRPFQVVDYPTFIAWGMAASVLIGMASVGYEQLRAQSHPSAGTYLVLSQLAIWPASGAPILFAFFSWLQLGLLKGLGILALFIAPFFVIAWIWSAGPAATVIGGAGNRTNTGDPF